MNDKRELNTEYGPNCIIFHYVQRESSAADDDGDDDGDEGEMVMMVMT